MRSQSSSFFFIDQNLVYVVFGTKSLVNFVGQESLIHFIPHLLNKNDIYIILGIQKRGHQI